MKGLLLRSQGFLKRLTHRCYPEFIYDPRRLILHVFHLPFSLSIAKFMNSFSSTISLSAVFKSQCDQLGILRPLWFQLACILTSFFFIAFITCNSNLVPLLEGLCASNPCIASNPCRFDFSVF